VDAVITFFSLPKPFNERFGDIQYNAIRSWVELGPSVRVVLLGDESGTAEVARELNLSHWPDITRNEYGTPLLDRLFELAEERDDNPYLNYVNCDIVLLGDFLVALRDAVRRKTRFLMVGQRTDFDQQGRLDFSPGWEDRLRAEARARGRLHRPTGIDYFVYRRGVWSSGGGLPPFAVGRFTWDNWMIYRARQLQLPVIDATQRVLAIHQNHDYSHAAGGLKGARHGPEARRNLALAGGNKHLFTIWDATHVLTDRGVERRRASPGGLGGGIWSYRRSAAAALH
jgi:hypothetical protein